MRKETVSQDAIKDRAIKMEKIDWQKAEWFQPKSLKLCMEVDFNKLVASLQDNDFADPLKVWEYQPGKIKILDGHHRQKALEYCLQNGEKKPPKMLNAIFMDCKNEQKAAKLCLIYASEYAKIQVEGLYEYLHTFNLPLDDIKADVKFPGLDLDDFEQNFYKELEIKERQIEYFKKTHVLFSFSPELLIEIQDKLEEIKKTKGVEYEQSSN